jgi:hypothetical protein
VGSNRARAEQGQVTLRLESDEAEGAQARATDHTGLSDFAETLESSFQRVVGHLPTDIQTLHKESQQTRSALLIRQIDKRCCCHDTYFLVLVLGVLFFALRDASPSRHMTRRVVSESQEKQKDGLGENARPRSHGARDWHSTSTWGAAAGGLAAAIVVS